MQGKTTVKEAISKMEKKPANLFVSDKGRSMLRQMVSIFKPDSDYINARELTIQNTRNIIRQCRASAV